MAPEPTFCSAVQEALSLANPPPLPTVSPAVASALPSGATLETQVQALRASVQAQQQELETLQLQAQSQPLLGWTSDSSWGMALEGLLMGVAALGLGALSMWGARTGPGRVAARGSGMAASKPASPGFSDSMLYLADQDDEQAQPQAVSARLHDPRYDAQARAWVHDEDDPELDYYRMALTQQGLSVTVGAGQVDSDRMPLDAGREQPADSTSSATVPASVFAPALNPANAPDFDERAAAEEVERVRRYLAQRRADRESTKANSLRGESMQDSSDVLTEANPNPVGEVSDAPFPSMSPSPASAQDVAPKVLATEGDDAARGLDALQHIDLSDGASLLVGLRDESSASETGSASALQPSPAETPTELPPGAMQDGQLDAAPEGDETLAAADGMGALPATEIQWQLALEFRELGLWDEAYDRALEVLESPEAAWQEKARALLEELVQTRPAPLGARVEPEDPWR